MHRRFLPLALGALLVGLPALSRADDPPPAKTTDNKLPTSADVKGLQAYRKQVKLVGGDDSCQRHHCCPAWPLGNSVRTSRFSGLKYVRATRCTSATVMF